MNIYLDNSATTPLRGEVINEINDMMNNCYGNPSSLHRMGLEAEKKVMDSRKKVAESLGVSKDEIYFTSGGTESNNMAIRGIVDRFENREIHIITSKVEHASVLNLFRELENRAGVTVDYAEVDERGIVELSKFRDLLREKTVLVSIMAVNNETGAIQPLREIKNIMKEKQSKAYFHSDGVQAFGKTSLSLDSLGVDLFSFSGHKINAPKGVGGLYIRKGVSIKPLVYGGGQEKNIRSGTENTIGIVGMGKAIEIADRSFSKDRVHIEGLKRVFLESLSENVKEYKLNSPEGDMFLPNIVSLSFEGTRGEILLHTLEDKGIFISTTSACSSKDRTKSHVLSAMGLSEAEIEGSIRVSFGYQNTREEVELAVKELKTAVEEIRSIMKR